MKKRFCLFILLYTFGICVGQNLVPNPSFEQHIACPTSLNQMNHCMNWSSFGASSDYYHSCGVGVANVPNTYWGSQYAHSGDAFAGMITYSYLAQNIREFIGVPLVSTLVPGQTYFVSFYIHYAFSGIAANKLGCRFSTISYSFSDPAPIDNFSVVHTDSLLKDSVSWLYLSGSFIADSAYSYLIIGNFYDDNNTDTTTVVQSTPHGYYFIDDVCVSSDSTICFGEVGVNELNVNSDFTMFPNPFNRTINIKLRSGDYAEFILYDIMSKIRLQTKLVNSISIDTEQFTKGIYFYELILNNKVFVCGKIMKE